MDYKGSKKITQQTTPMKSIRPTTPEAREVEFTYNAPKAKEVCLAGTFNNWDPRSLHMKPTRSGAWTAKVNLPPGRYEYKVVVDGQWAQDIPGEEKVANPFGTVNWVKQVR